MLDWMLAFTLAVADPVSVSGNVPDEGMRSAIIAGLRAQFGDVHDETAIGKVSAPPQWDQVLLKMIGPALKLVHKGQFSVDGRHISLSGEVANEAERQQVTAALNAALDPAYSLNVGLRVVGGDQAVLDSALADRVVEFETGKTSLTDNGRQILDQMSEALLKVKNRKVAIIGHTDNAGQRQANLALSLARAEAVRDYVLAKGIAASMISVSGEGPDRPVADNGTPEGRARNRRIEFRVLP